MICRFFIYLGLIFTITATSLAVLFNLGLTRIAVPVSVSAPPPRGVILLVPLDSRPPCTDYVTSLAHMAGFHVLLPPKELMDDYRRPGNAAGMREWLRNGVSRADAAIISVDMLVHGGLLSSRKSEKSAETADEVLALLTHIHEKHPQVKLYAFNIIPRLLISDDPFTEKHKQPMAEWSMLLETTSLFENPRDILRLQELESSIPSDLLTRYRDLYANNRRLNQRLVALTQAGILSGLVIGQDDSAPFGLGNMERQRLSNELGSHPETLGSIFITRGTDEVALTLLNPATRSKTEARHKVYVHYTEARAADAILPYMPRPLAQIVEEKLAIAAADATESIIEADYILVIHAGNTHSLERHLSEEADRIRAWIGTGRNVAIVDLATDWTVNQTLLPYLRRNGTSVHQTLAYAGWNTASNSIGTAVAQAGMVLQGRVATAFPVALHRDLVRAKFLSERILDDWYYQKIYRHLLNEELERQKIDPYDLKKTRQPIADRINRQIDDAYLQYIRRDWRDAVFPLNSGNTDSYVIDTGEVRAGLPWNRTFEIFVNTSLSPARVLPR